MPADLQFNFNLQDHLRDMEQRLTTAIEESKNNSSTAYMALSKSILEMDAKLDSFHTRLSVAENDIRIAKRVGYAGITGVITLALDLVKKWVVGS